MTSTIVPFSTPIPSPVQKPVSRQSRRDQIMRQRGQQLTPEQMATADGMAAAMVGLPRPWTADDHAAHVAMVVRIAVRSAKRRGVRLESLLPIPRRWLLDLCEAGDPTAMVVRDWLTGARKNLPIELDGAVAASSIETQEDAQ